MALIKREYKDNETVITAENMNDIQDAIIALEEEQEIGTVASIDFTNFQNGSFTEVVDGETITHSVTFDDSGNPVKIDGVTIVWG